MTAATQVAADPPASSARGRVPRVLFAGLVVAATGGPLALAAQNVPAALSDARHSAVPALVLGGLAFVAPVYIWLAYSRRVTSPGGLAAFVEAAAGTGVARVQATVWTASYLMYLLYTVGFIVADVLPPAIPAVGEHRTAVQAGLAVALLCIVLLPLRAALTTVSLLAVGQGLLIAVLLILGHAGGAVGQLAAHDPVPRVTLAGFNASLLFICSSLPLFLAHEVHGGAAAVRSGLVAGLAITFALVAVGTVAVASGGPRVVQAALPGSALATDGGHGGLSPLIGAGVAASVLGVMAAEFLALSRLLHFTLRLPVRRLSFGLAVALAVSTFVGPARLYEVLLKPSLVALWISQLIVFAVYPRFAAAQAGRWTVGSLLVSAAASLLMGFGLYSTLFLASGT